MVTIEDAGTSISRPDRKIRLLFICPGYGKIDRGVEVFLRELARRLDRSRFEVTILGRVDSEADHLRCVRIRTVDRSAFDFFRCAGWVWRGLRLVKLGGAAEVESLLFSLYSAYYLSRHSFDLIVPLGGFWSYAAAAIFKKSSKIVSIGQAGPVKADLRLSDVFVALTDFSRDEALAIAPGLDAVIIPNGVDLSRFTPSGEIARRSRTVLCVAAFVPDKRHDLLFDAMMRLDSSVSLLCVAPGSVPSRLKAHPLCRCHRVEFRSVSHDQMPAIYRDADVFTLASPEEAFGIVFLEALASGLNVVAADAPRQRYVLGSAGWYCDVSDPEAYARTLAAALGTPQPAVNVARAERFSWERSVALYQRLFESLMPASGSDRSDANVR
jgi:glycosyltransferase involved in cell wall biosynthesis